MTKPHFSTISSSSSSQEIQECMSKGLNCIPERTGTIPVCKPHSWEPGFSRWKQAGCLTLRTSRSPGQQAATVLWPILMIPPPPHTKRKLDHNLYQNLLRGTSGFLPQSRAQMNTDSRKMISLIWFMIQLWIFTRFPNILTRKPVHSGVSWQIHEFVTDYS